MGGGLHTSPTSLARQRIYVALTEGGAQKRRISPSGGRWPRWRGDGKELYYYAPDGFIMASIVTAGAQWNSAPPAPLVNVGPQVRTSM